jgi:sarcosine oxidase
MAMRVPSAAVTDRVLTENCMSREGSVGGMGAEADVVVVGLGALGSSAAYWSVRRGLKVIGLEQFELGHVRGASHDHSRIIRRSYNTAHYVRLTADAYSAWRSLEADAGEQLLTITGGVDLFPAGSFIDPHTYTAALTTARVPFEWIDSAEIRRRWPVFAQGSLMHGDVMGIATDGAGIAPAARGTAAMQRMAVQHGADLRANTPVRSLRVVGGEVEVVTDSGVIRAGHAVVTTDAWSAKLLRTVGVELPMMVTREQLSYFPHADLDRFAVGRMPVWIWMDDPAFYGFPVYGDTTAVKAAEDCGGPEVDADTRTFEPDATMQRRLADFMTAMFGDGFGEPRSATCLYAMTSDRDFLLDTLPGLPQVSAALGSGHGFKFAAWFGRRLADIAAGERGPDHDIAPFSFSRPALHEPIDRANWMV